MIRKRPNFGKGDRKECIQIRNSRTEIDLMRMRVLWSLTNGGSNIKNIAGGLMVLTLSAVRI